MDIDPLPVSIPGISLLIPLINAIEFVAPPNWVSWSFIVLIAVLCLFLSAFVSGSEIAYFALRPGQIDELEESEDPARQRVASLLSDSERFLATILISNNLVNVTLVVLLTFAINQTVKFHSSVLNFFVQTIFLTFILLLFGEIFPKLVARGRPELWAVKTSGALERINKFLAPLSKVMAKSSMIINKVVSKHDKMISADELEKALEISDIKEGQEREMLEGILSFGEKEVSDIMIPRIDVTSIEYHDSWQEVMKVTVESGYSRIPVYDTSQDIIKGILYAKDLLPYIGNDAVRVEWQKLVRPAYFVPESRMIDDLLEDFRKKKIHIAIVVDEYGGTQGIVTLEDIIEEILGEIDDEYDEESKFYRKIQPDTWIFDAKISLGDFCHALGIDEESLGDTGDAETLAGLLLEIKGDFPYKNETLRRDGLKFTVLKIEKHRILQVKVQTDGK